MDPAPLPPQPGRAPETSAKKYSLTDYTFQFITITAGVLIALLINGLVEWNANRNLVRDARANIALELAANKKEVDMLIASTPDRLKQIDAALSLANGLLAAQPNNVRSLHLNFTLAELSSAAWRTAERTGALSHMEYQEVQRFSALYDFQDLFAERQGDLVAQVADAFSVLGPDFDPSKPHLKDMESFRQQILRLRGTHDIQGKLAILLAEKYQALITS
jgi:hypothetical protein